MTRNIYYMLQVIYSIIYVLERNIQFSLFKRKFKPIRYEKAYRNIQKYYGDEKLTLT